MNILVLISGIIDPKWPLSVRTLTDADALAAAPRKLSPFDESALECALKLRDADAGMRVSALVVSPFPAEPLLRAVAAFRLGRVSGLATEAGLVWDARAGAAVLAQAVLADNPDVVFMGREFGDFDDGLLAPCLAECLGWTYAGLVQEATLEAGGLVLLRERGDLEERIHAKPPLLASITNDRRNRLRFPLMKNIAAARKDRFSTADGTSGIRPGIASRALRDAPAGDARPCRMIAGDIETQAAELAAWLKAGA